MAAIEGVGPAGASRIGGRGRARASAGFAVPAETTVPDQAATVAVSAAGLTSMLALQELGDETTSDGQSRRHGQDMLAALADLQRALLSGSDGMAALQHLALLAAAVPRATDARLAALVSAVTVRVRVELARRRL